MKALSLITLFVAAFFLNFSLVAGEEEKENNAPTALVVAHIEPVEVAPSKVEVKKEEIVSKPLRTLSKKEIRAMVKEVKAEMKESKKSGKGPANWEPNLKIGATLIVLAIVLTFLGIGWVGSLAALAGLFFVIVGLLHTYN